MYIKNLLKWNCIVCILLHLAFLTWGFISDICSTCKDTVYTSFIHSNHSFSWVQFSRLVVSDSLQSHELQHARPPCPSPTPGVQPNPCSWSRWCHPAISSSVVPFSSCPQSFPASGSFQWVSSSHQVAKVLAFQPQHQSFQRTSRTDLL